MLSEDTTAIHELDNAIQTFVNEVAYLDFESQEVLNGLAIALSKLTANSNNETSNHEWLLYWNTSIN